MSTKVIMPQMGESIFEGTITKWLKKVGDKIDRDEPLFEISTDKVDSEIPSPAAGIVAEILALEGTTVQINTVVAIISEATAEAGTQAAPPPAPPPAAPAPQPEAPGPIPETAAAAEAPPKKEEAGAAISAPKAEDKAPPARKAAFVQAGDIRTSPLVRRLAREHNINLSDVRGTGHEGRITKQDVLDYLEQRPEPAAAPEAAAAPPVVPEITEAPAAEPAAAEAVSEPPQAEAPPAAQAAPSAAAPEAPRFFGEVESIPMTPMRKAIAEHMLLSKHTSAHVNTVFEVDMTPIVRLRERHQDEFEKREGVKLTYTAFLVKALVETVREFPIVNSSVSGDKVILKKPVNVGIAVALETGLIVPVVKDAHLKSFTGIALAINDLANKARGKRLRPDDVQNGTITITNPGIYGSLFGTPIINQPQVAILGVGGIEKRPVVIDDAIAIRSMVYLSLSFDHRVIDGAVADQFMASLKHRLQTWEQWID